MVNELFNSSFVVAILLFLFPLTKVDCRIPLQPLTALLPPEPIPLADVSHNLLKQLRQYLTLCRELHYEVTPDIQKVRIYIETIL